MSRRPIAVCLDLGSTFTKAVAVDLDLAAVVATASHRTTVDTDVLDGVDAVLARLDRAGVPVGDARVLACSSAGGGLRVAVVGQEREVTAEAGHRVGLSAGARVVHVAAGRLGQAGVAALAAADPDVVLLVGGTDGGNPAVLRHNGTVLARASALPAAVPVVLAGNVALREEVAALLRHAGRPVTAAANVLPRIGVLDPGPARAAIREVFLRHVIGGKGLSRGPRLAAMVRGATPDLVLTGVEALTTGPDGPGDVLVVDVGGATTDVYSVVTPDPEVSTLRREVVEAQRHARTVEGDLGVRWSAPGVVEAARAERLLADGEAAPLAAAAELRADAPGLLPPDPEDGSPGGPAGGGAVDRRLAELAATVALRRHARAEPPATGRARQPGRDLRGVTLVIGSGGVFRHASGDPAAALRPVLGDTAGGWPLPRAAHITIDTAGVLAAAGLLAAEHPAAAGALLRSAFRPLSRPAPHPPGRPARGTGLHPVGDTPSGAGATRR